MGGSRIPYIHSRVELFTVDSFPISKYRILIVRMAVTEIYVSAGVRASRIPGPYGCGDASTLHSFSQSQNLTRHRIAHFRRHKCRHDTSLQLSQAPALTKHPLAIIEDALTIETLAYSCGIQNDEAELRISERQMPLEHQITIIAITNADNT